MLKLLGGQLEVLGHVVGQVFLVLEPGEAHEALLRVESRCVRLADDSGRFKLGRMSDDLFDEVEFGGVFEVVFDARVVGRVDSHHAEVLVRLALLVHGRR